MRKPNGPRHAGGVSWCALASAGRGPVLANQRVARRAIAASCALVLGCAGAMGEPDASGGARRMSEQNAEAARGMDRQVRLASLHATVGEALDWIERMSGQEVRALEVDDTHLTGIDRGARVELDDLQGSLWDVLARVLEASGEPGDRVEWQYATDGAIVCAPVSRLNGLRTTVVYDIQDLLRVAPDWTEAPDLDLEQALQGSGSFLQGGEEAPPAELVSPARPRWMDLAELITSVVEPEVWSENGGESLLMHRAGVLVVKAPGYVHRQLGGDPNQPRADRGEAGVSRQ